MESFILLCGFFGAWLLVAGPIYQAALELQEEDIERDQIDAYRQNLPKQPHASPWWWLLPPVKIFLERKLNNQYRRDFITALPTDVLEAMIHFMNKASGWILVSIGGLLLALKETYELVAHMEWSVVLFWVIAFIMAALCVTNTAIRMSRTKQLTTRTRD